MTRDRLPIEPDPALDIREITIKARDDYDIRLRIYRHNSTAENPAPKYVPLFIVRLIPLPFLL